MIQEPRITKLQSLIDQGNNLITTNKGKDAAAGIWKSMAARESFSGGSGIAGEKTAFGALRDAQASSYNTAVGQKMSFAAAAAGAAIIAAAEAPSEFVSRVARESTDPKFANYMAVANDNSLSLDYGRDPWTSSKVAQEYYSDKDLDKNLGLSWALNVRALETQSKFAETLYPTITVETNDVGITIRTKVTCVTRGLLNALLQKDSVEDDRQPLHWALSNHKVLEDDAIRIVPYRMEDNKNAEFFVDPAVIDNTTARLGRCPEYPTNYLNFDKKKFNVFSLAAHPGIVQAGYDESDEVAPGASLGKLLLSVREKSQALKDGQLVEIITRDMQFASFQRPAEGDGRELMLNFRHTVHSMSKKTLDRSGKELKAIAPFGQQDLTVRYTMNITMSLFTGGQRNGELLLSGHDLSIDSVIDADGVEQKIEGSIKTLVDNLVIELYGWKLDATRTNENRRSQGLMLDPIWEQENYKLQYGSPIMTKQPVNTEYNDTERLDDLVSAVNIRNELLAVGQTLAYTDQIKQTFATRVTAYDRPAIRGLGRHWVGCWYDEQDFNVRDIVQSLETKDALINARQALMQRLGDQVTRAVQESRFIQSMRLISADPSALPKVILATDEPTAAMLLLQTGDGRLLGDRYEYEVITTNDDRWRVKNTADGTWNRRLQWMLKVPGVEDGTYCVLNWGNHFWSPIMVTNMNIQRNGATSKELAVQPRNAHINHCPITGVLWIKGITDLVAKKLAYYVGVTNAAPTPTPPTP